LEMKVILFSSLFTVASANFLGLPDPLGLFGGGPKCPAPEPCVCVCDKPDHYVPPPPHYEVSYTNEIPPPPPAYQKPPSYVPPPPSYVPPPPPPLDYSVPLQFQIMHQIPSKYTVGPSYPTPNMYGSSPNYIPEFKARRKAARH
ncbi:hypothetical protein PMAYCL1PPCAC_21850, partial [Pristionchus mayeri]